MKQCINIFIHSFLKKEDGAQVVEYALIIATISIALIVLIDPLKDNFGTWVGRVTACLSTSGTCA